MASNAAIIKKPAPCGSWSSKITSDMVVKGTISFTDLTTDGDDIYWVERRPEQNGQYVVVKYSAGEQTDITPNGFSARTIIYSYGGSAVTVSKGSVYFSNYDTVNFPQTNDQRLFRQTPGKVPKPLTPLVAMRYGDAVVHHDRLICVREDHTLKKDGYPIVAIVAISLDGETEEKVLISGDDFYSSPTISPDGSKIAWLSWNFPRMPWDSNELWVADIDVDGSLKNQRKIAGDTSRLNPDEAIISKILNRSVKTVSEQLLSQPQALFQPQWSPDGKNLYFVSDLNNWWNIYRCNVEEKCLVAEMITVNAPSETEFGVPQWNLGMSTYICLPHNRLVASYTKSGRWYLALIDTQSKEFKEITVKFNDTLEIEVTYLSHVKATASGKVVFIGGAYNYPSSIILFDPNTGNSEVLKPAMNNYSTLLSEINEYLSPPSEVKFTGTNPSEKSYAFNYYPTNPAYCVPDDEKPPLLIVAHGGPTAATTTTLNLIIQYFTSRGFSVADVNYRGSTGYGRPYRLSLYEQWGIYDRDDCVNCAKYLAKEKTKESDHLIDFERVIIRGGSAGGYLTLVVATYTDLCKAGASYYGISDLITLVKDTHKFEAQYPYELVCPYPSEPDIFSVQEKKIYMMRSPIYALDLLNTPLIFFQGTEDPVVPPEQSQKMVKAIKDKGQPVAYKEYEHEQHGFRIAQNVKNALELEFNFYSQILGFKPADELPPVNIYNQPK